jgi:hypothetical protein
MRKVYYTLDMTEAVLLKDHLLHSGVEASVSNTGAVRIPHEGIASEVWVSDRANDDEVRRLIHAFLQQRTDRSGDAKASWSCRECGEDSPGDFELCWNCGRRQRAAHQ